MSFESLFQPQALSDFSSVSPPERLPLAGRAVPAPPPPPRQRRRRVCARPRPCPGGATLGWGWARSLHGTARRRQCRSLGWTRRRPRRATAARSATAAASGGRDPKRWERDRQQSRAGRGTGAPAARGDAPALPPRAGVSPHLFLCGVESVAISEADAWAEAVFCAFCSVEVGVVRQWMLLSAGFPRLPFNSGWFVSTEGDVGSCAATHPFSFELERWRFINLWFILENKPKKMFLKVML